MSTLVKSKASPALRSMLEDFWSPDRFFGRPFSEGFFNAPFFGREFLPAVNVRETKHHYELEFAVPGFKKDDFKVETENGILTISAEKEGEKKKIKKIIPVRNFLMLRLHVHSTCQMMLLRIILMQIITMAFSRSN